MINCDAFTTQAAGGVKYVNASSIGFIEQRKPEKEVTQNAPGITFTLSENGKPDREVLLYAQELNPLILTLDGKKVFADPANEARPGEASTVMNLSQCSEDAR